MAIFFNIFLKTFAYLVSISLIILLFTLIFSLINNENRDEFAFSSGEETSSNTIAIIEMNGLIIEKNRNFVELANPLIISPSEVNDYLENLKNFSKKIIIFSINSPGGTVSASKNLYDIITKFKQNNKTEIIFHTNEILASGGYWASLSGDKIYANYGSILGSIGVKGPEWFFYDNPKSISTGIFGNRIETINGIKVYSKIAGKSKDILNPFRKPSEKELEHLQKMVDEIYEDFVRIVSKERKIEINTITEDIGALIYTTKSAKKKHLIDGELTLENLIQKIIKEKEFSDYKIIKTSNQSKSFLKQILNGQINIPKIDLDYECLSLRSSISTILSYQSVGC